MNQEKKFAPPKTEDSQVVAIARLFRWFLRVVNRGVACDEFACIVTLLVYIVKVVRLRSIFVNKTPRPTRGIF